MHSFIEEYCEKLVAVGSRVTCSPAPTDTDQDYLVYCPDEGKFYDMMKVLDEHFYEKGGSDIMSAEQEVEVFGEFSSYKKGDVNYIVTMSGHFFAEFVNATNVAKLLNLQDKAQRVKLFRLLLYDNWPDNFVWVED